MEGRGNEGEARDDDEEKEARGILLCGKRRRDKRYSFWIELLYGNGASTLIASISREAILLTGLINYLEEYYIIEYYIDLNEISAIIDSILMATKRKPGRKVTARLSKASITHTLCFTLSFINNSQHEFSLFSARAHPYTTSP